LTVFISERDKLSQERKKLQEEELLPEWFTTAGYQLFKSKYQWATTPREQYETIANTLALHTDDFAKWSVKFFLLLWNGWLSPSTPVLANTGTTRGLPVSCSGGYIQDSVDGFYTSRREAALLTKYGFGTSGYLGDIRSRGSSISAGGKASGVTPVLRGFVQDSRDVSQGNTRRGSWAGYLPIDHGDFHEVVSFLEKEPDDLNIGWNISDDFVSRLEAGEADARERMGKALKAKLVTGKGYFFFPDKANRKLPKYYPMPVKASNLCSEIVLPSDEEHTFTCVLSSMNVAKYDEWKDTDAVHDATVFLDCVASEFISRARDIPGLENAVRFTEKARALGL
jgi:ribonucleoside-diphosphate reductase alpha chain